VISHARVPECQNWMVKRNQLTPLPFKELICITVSNNTMIVINDIMQYSTVMCEWD